MALRAAAALRDSTALSVRQPLLLADLGSIARRVPPSRAFAQRACTAVLGKLLWRVLQAFTAQADRNFQLNAQTGTIALRALLHQKCVRLATATRFKVEAITLALP